MRKISDGPMVVEMRDAPMFTVFTPKDAPETSRWCKGTWGVFELCGDCGMLDEGVSAELKKRGLEWDHILHPERNDDADQLDEGQAWVEALKEGHALCKVPDRMPPHEASKYWRYLVVDVILPEIKTPKTDQRVIERMVRAQNFTIFRPKNAPRTKPVNPDYWDIFGIDGGVCGAYDEDVSTELDRRGVRLKAQGRAEMGTLVFEPERDDEADGIPERRAWTEALKAGHTLCKVPDRMPPHEDSQYFRYLVLA